MANSMYGLLHYTALEPPSLMTAPTCYLRSGSAAKFASKYTCRLEPSRFPRIDGRDSVLFRSTLFSKDSQDVFLSRGKISGPVGQCNVLAIIRGSHFPQWILHWTSSPSTVGSASNHTWPCSVLETDSRLRRESDTAQADRRRSYRRRNFEKGGAYICLMDSELFHQGSWRLHLERMCPSSRHLPFAGNLFSTVYNVNWVDMFRKKWNIDDLIDKYGRWEPSRRLQIGVLVK